MTILFLLKQALLVFILPPLSLVMWAAVGLVLTRWWPRIGRWLTAGSITMLLVLSLPIVAGALIRTLELGLVTEPPPDAPPKAIVILGAEVTRTRIGPETVIAGKMTLDRLRAGAELQRRTGLPILVTGGSVNPRILPVGTTMARSLQWDFRVPVAWTEEKSKDTWENATLSAAILREVGVNSVYVVTQASHMPRALLAFRKAGLVATAAPTSIDPPLEFTALDMLPSASSWDVMYFVFHEWVGLVWYWLK